jgi:hypothetical protein
MRIPAFTILALAVTCAATQTIAWSASAPITKQDSGWVPLFDGSTLDGFYTYFETVGALDAAKQDAFYAEGGMIHVPKSHDGGYTRLEGHLITAREYSWYRVRIDYRYSPDTGAQNAGLVFHIDNTAGKSGTFKDKRPRSIEINMRRAEASPWTLWSAANLGPYLTSTVKPGTQQYLPKAQGGSTWINNPWGGDKRVLYSTVPNPENPQGEWNHGEAFVYGDSLGRFYLNGVLRTEAWDFRLRAPGGDTVQAHRTPCDRGGIGIQSEQHEIWYRNFEIMELEPHTLRPLHAQVSTLRGISQASRSRRQVAGAGAMVLPGRRNPSAGVDAGKAYWLDGRTAVPLEAPQARHRKDLQP